MSQCTSCGGFCKKSGCERADYVPPKREWVGLTDEDVRRLADKHLYYQPEGYVVSGVFELAKAIEAILKEKNT